MEQLLRATVSMLRPLMIDEIPPTRRGYDTREVVSAVQKAIRRSDPDAALYWGIEPRPPSGFGRWLWKRLKSSQSRTVRSKRSA